MGISIHALREEGDCIGCFIPLHAERFLSTPSARRATSFHRPACYPHSNFYPRPPRGGRRALIRPLHTASRFLSTPSARRATGFGEALYPGMDISIHALREEGDGYAVPSALCHVHFYPRPPRGGRQLAYRAALDAKKFLSTPSARRATAKTETKSLFSNKLYNILHEFRRALIYNGSKSYPNHAK